jgi:hypothetical protein
LERGEPSPSGMPDPRTMTDAELEQCLAEIQRLDAKWEGPDATLAKLISDLRRR